MPCISKAWCSDHRITLVNDLKHYKLMLKVCKSNIRTKISLLIIYIPVFYLHTFSRIKKYHPHFSIASKQNMVIGGIDAKCANIDFRQDFCMTFLNFQNCAIDDLWCKLCQKLTFLNCSFARLIICVMSRGAGNGACKKKSLTAWANANLDTENCTLSSFLIRYVSPTETLHTPWAGIVFSFHNFFPTQKTLENWLTKKQIFLIAEENTKLIVTMSVLFEAWSNKYMAKFI